MFSSPPNVQPSVVRVSWTAAGSNDPLVTGVRYALYSQCGAEATFQLINDDIQRLSYNITTLPSLTQCVLRVVVYSHHCLRTSMVLLQTQQTSSQQVSYIAINHAARSSFCQSTIISISAYVCLFCALDPFTALSHLNIPSSYM